MMRICLLGMITLLWVVTSCTPVTSPSPTATPEIPPKQPEPGRPLIGGQISGLPEAVEATIYVKTPEDRIVSWGGATGEVPWEAVVHQAGGFDYIVTAEAEGYISQPISYTIHISDDTAYVVRDGEVTNEEALHLDFHFTPEPSP